MAEDVTATAVELAEVVAGAWVATEVDVVAAAATEVEAAAVVELFPAAALEDPSTESQRSFWAPSANPKESRYIGGS